MSWRAQVVQRVPRGALVRLNRHPELKRMMARLGDAGGPRGIQRVELPAGPCKGATMTLDFATTERNLWLGTYEPWVAATLARALRPDSRVWDVGAHIGYYLIFAGRFSGGGHLAIEADPANVDRLTTHLRDNSVEAEVMPVAVGRTNGTLRFRAFGNSALSRAESDGDLEVPMVSLDSLLDNHTPPTLVIMDIEGGEQEALQGARRLLGQIRPMLLVELHGRKGLAAYEQLEAEGYRIDAPEEDVRSLLTSTTRHARTHVLATPS